MVFGCAGRKNELATVFKLKRHRTFGAQVAAMFAKGMAHVGHSAHPVVGHGVDDDGRATNAIALVANFFVLQAV